MIDYRYVNTLIEDDPYPLPNIDMALKNLKDNNYFSLIDLNWGFWNVRLTKEAQDFTGFCVPERGVFKWRVMPFGLKTSLTTFQRAIKIALRPLLNSENVKVYIDDIIIAGKTVDEN